MTKQSKTEQSKAEQSKTEQSKTEQTTSPVETADSKAGSSKSNQASDTASVAPVPSESATAPTTVEALFDQGLERYRAGEPAAALLPLFKEVCERAPKSSPAWTCLSWLYLLDGKPTQAHKAAQKAVKLNPQDPQARINLAIAMLETAQKGVRQHVEIAGQIVMAVAELREEVEQNFEDGLSRKPDWQSLIRVKTWLFES